MKIIFNFWRHKNFYFSRLNARIKLNNELYQTELDNLKNKALCLDNSLMDKENEINRLRKEIQELNQFSSVSSDDLKMKENNFKLIQYEYEENIIEVLNLLFVTNNLLFYIFMNSLKKKLKN